MGFSLQKMFTGVMVLVSLVTLYRLYSLSPATPDDTTRIEQILEDYIRLKQQNNNNNINNNNNLNEMEKIAQLLDKVKGQQINNNGNFLQQISINYINKNSNNNGNNVGGLFEQQKGSDTIMDDYQCVFPTVKINNEFGK